MSPFDFVPGARHEPLYLEHFLVEVWRFQSVGRDDDARRLLASVWSWAMDDVASEQDVRVAARLLERLAFVTDDAEGWQALPDELVIYRAETSPAEPTRGLCWTLDHEIAERNAILHGLSVTRGRVSKAAVRAYITGYGEEEIVVERAHVKHET